MEEWLDSMYTAADAHSVLKEICREEAKRTYRLQVRLALKTGDWSEIFLPERIKELMQRGQEIENIFSAEARERNDGKAREKWFVTINAPSTVDPVELWKKVSGYCSKNVGRGIGSYYVVIEQRSEDPEHPKGWHVHMCVGYKEEMSRSIVYQRLRALCRNFWSDDEMKKSEFKKYWVTVIPLGDYHEKYVTGDKREEKMAKVQADKIAREKYGFPEFASSSENIFPVEVRTHAVQEVS